MCYIVQLLAESIAKDSQQLKIIELHDVSDMYNLLYETNNQVDK
jgi:hypothetical protein